MGADAFKIVFGGCCINEIAGSLQGHPTGFHICHTPQCFEMFAGKTFVEDLILKGAFLVTPGWLVYWDKWVDDSGFDTKTAKEFFRESASRIVLLDTGIDPAAEDNLTAFSQYAGLPAETMSVGIDVFKIFFHRRILMVRQEAARRRSDASRKELRRQQADFAMILDLLGELPKAGSEKEAFERTASVFTMLFAPQSIVYAEKQDFKPARAWILTMEGFSAHADDEAERIAEQVLKKKLILTKDGLILRMASRHGLVRGLGVKNVAFPQYLDRYAPMARAVADVCGLAIDNARSYENLMENQKRLHVLATTDSLTGVANRAHFMGKAEDEIVRARRYQSSFALIVLDVDHFKNINDTHGHPVGDEILKAIADICQKQMRQSDMIGRVGGEEFAAIICNAGTKEGISVAGRMRKNIENYFYTNGAEKISCTASFGVTAWEGPADSLTSMFKRADAALYQAKSQGRNRVVLTT
jgi:diguanylate cyclase (GGDEF)-like protein